MWRILEDLTFCSSKRYCVPSPQSIKNDSFSIDNKKADGCLLITGVAEPVPKTKKSKFINWSIVHRQRMIV